MNRHAPRPQGDFQEAFRLFGVPLWVLPAVELPGPQPPPGRTRVPRHRPPRGIPASRHPGIPEGELLQSQVSPGGGRHGDGVGAGEGSGPPQGSSSWRRSPSWSSWCGSCPPSGSHSYRTRPTACVSSVAFGTGARPCKSCRSQGGFARARDLEEARSPPATASPRGAVPLAPLLSGCRPLLWPRCGLALWSGRSTHYATIR